MGGNNSIQITFEGNQTCLICWEQIDIQELTKCVECNISLHKLCESTYRGNRGHCKCPHCQRIGSLGCLRIS